VDFTGGIFLDMASHDFDMARFLVGSEIEEVGPPEATHLPWCCGDK
jgi:predicted dehydrogenase